MSNFLKSHYPAIYAPMVLGAVIGWAVSHYLGVGGVVGMISGAGLWLAYEMRQNTRRMEVDRQLMEHDLDWLRDQQRNAR